MPVGEYIANVPDFWKASQTNFGASLLHFGNDAYWLGNYTRAGPGFGNTTFVPTTPVPQTMAHGANEGHGFFDDTAVTSSTSTTTTTTTTTTTGSRSGGRFIWFGSVGGRPPAEPGVPPWDGYLTVARHLEVDWGPSTAGDFPGQLVARPVKELETLRGALIFESDNVLDGGGGGGGPAEPAVAGVGAGAEILFVSGKAGAYSLNGVPLAPAGRMPRPTALSLRVLVDRSIVEAFGQGGRATQVTTHYIEDGNQTAVVWRPPGATAGSAGTRGEGASSGDTGGGGGGGGGYDMAATTPRVSIRVWKMYTGYF
eukprot:g2931.t1